MNFSHFRLASIKGSEGMTKLTRTEGNGVIHSIQPLNQFTKLSEIDGGLK